MRYFNVYWTDLDCTKQQELIDEIKVDLIEGYKNEAENGKFGKNFGRDEYKDMTWQEAVCREYAIDFSLWETDEEAKKFDWEFAVEQHAEEEAEEKCSEAFKNLKIEVANE